MPDRVGQAHDALRGRQRDQRTAGADLHRSTNPDAGRCSAERRKFTDDPLWSDHLLFYEYFHGDNGAGIGASHQTGWTGLIASLMHYFATVSPKQALDLWSTERTIKKEPASRSPRRQARSRV